jgi:hypothetical protein
MQRAEIYKTPSAAFLQIELQTHLAKSLFKSVRANVLFPDFFGPLTTYTESGMESAEDGGVSAALRAILHDSGSMNGSTSLVLCVTCMTGQMILCIHPRTAHVPSSHQAL